MPGNRSRRLARRPHLAALVLLLLGAGLASCRPRDDASGPPPEPPEGVPRLVLHVVIDQFRADYVERFDPVWVGGLRRLLDEGVLVPEMRHAHDATVTATGHATLATGMEPRHHGIVANSWYRAELGREAQSVEDPEYGVSPCQLLTPALGDHIKRRWPASRVFAVGGKDRASVLSAGLDADGAFWVDEGSGRIEGSTYYAATLPEWLEDFNRRRLLDRHFASPWTPLVEPKGLPAGLGLEPGAAFSHPLGGLSLAPNPAFYRAVAETPFIDAHVLELARTLIEAESLGQDQWPDLVAVLLPAADWVGHDFGPDSAELLDTVMRLDRGLGELLRWVDGHIGLDRVLVSVTSDHGVDQAPEVLQRRGVGAARLGWELITCFQGAGAEVGRRFGLELDATRGLRLDHQELRRRDLDAEVVKAALIERLEACPGVVRVHDGAELARRTDLDPMERLFAAGYHPGRSPELLVETVEHLTMTQRAVATHGTPHDYDALVPWLVRLPGGGGGRVDTPVRSVDLAPTLASLLGLDLGGAVDGASRAELIRQARRDAGVATPE